MHQTSPVNPPSRTVTSSDRARQFVAFGCSGERMLAPIAMVKEVIRMIPVTPVPQMPDWLEGVINLRGTIVPVIDLRRRLRLEVAPTNEDTSIMVVRIDGHLVGFIVDSVDRVLAVRGDQISEPPESVAARSGPHLMGLLEHGDDLFVVIDLTSVLNHDEVGLAVSDPT